MTTAPLHRTWAQTHGHAALNPADAQPATPDEQRAAHDLLNRYALAYDELRPDLFVHYFTQDAVVQTWLRDTKVAEFVGLDALVAGVVSVMDEQGPAQRRHLVTNVVTHRGAGELRSVAYTAVFVSEDPSIVQAGATAVYSATCTMIDGLWRIAHLTIGMDGYVGPPPRR